MALAAAESAPGISPPVQTATILTMPTEFGSSTWERPPSSERKRRPPTLAKTTLWQEASSKSVSKSESTFRNSVVLPHSRPPGGGCGVDASRARVINGACRCVGPERCSQQQLGSAASSMSRQGVVLAQSRGDLGWISNRCESSTAQRCSCLRGAPNRGWEVAR